MSTRGRVRRALQRAGGILSEGNVREAGPRLIAHPFAESRVVEGGVLRAIAVPAPRAAPDGVGFLGGIQRYVVDGHLGLIPVVRAWVAAGVLARRHGVLAHAASAGEEFMVVPAGRLDREQRAAVGAAGLSVVECQAGPRPHPLRDRWAAVRAIETRRAACEALVAGRVLAERDGDPLVVDGPLAAFAHLPGRARVVGVVRRQETLYLEGDDLAAALTLPSGHRSRVFAWSPAADGGGDLTYSWYLRLWPWTDEDLLHGLVRVERTGVRDPAAEADRVSRWLLADRAPIAGPDPHWDRQLYPMHEAEAYLRAHAGGWR